MSEASSTKPTESKQASAAARTGTATDAVKQGQTSAAGSEQSEPRETSRQRLLGGIIGIAALVVPMLLVWWLYSRCMAHESRVFSGPQQPVTSVAFSPDGNLVVASSQDGTVRIWDRNTGRELKIFNPDAGFARAVSFSPNGKKLLAAHDGAPRLYEMQSFTELKRLGAANTFVFRAAFSPDGKVLATASQGDKGVRLFDADTLEQTHFLGGYDKAIMSLAFSPNGEFIIAGDGTELKVWDVATGKVDRTLSKFTDGVVSVAYAPDGNQVAFAGMEKTIYLWDLRENKLVRTFEGHKSLVQSIAFSPDARYLVSGSIGTSKPEAQKNSAMPEEARTIRLWSVETGQEAYHVEHKEPVSSVTFSPDGRYILSGTGNQVRLWWLP
jgi:WD40 repeat protein